AGRAGGGRGLRLAHPSGEAAVADVFLCAQTIVRRQPPLGDGARRGEPAAGAAPPPRGSRRPAAARANLPLSRYHPGMKMLLAALLLSLAVQAAEQTLTLKVDGWHSKGDAYKTEQAVREVKGVTRASADVAAKQITVVYDDAAASAGSIEKAIAGAGYAAR